LIGDVTEWSAEVEVGAMGSACVAGGGVPGRGGIPPGPGGRAGTPPGRGMDPGTGATGRLKLGGGIGIYEK